MKEAPLLTPGLGTREAYQRLIMYLDLVDFTAVLWEGLCPLSAPNYLNGGKLEITERCVTRLYPPFGGVIYVEQWSKTCQGFRPDPQVALHGYTAHWYASMRQGAACLAGAVYYDYATSIGEWRQLRDGA